MRLTIVLFDGFTTLDIVGGYEVLARLPGMETEFIAREKGVVAADTRRLGLLAYRDFEETVSTDLLYVPGGPGVTALESDSAFLKKLRDLDATSTWTIGICNGVGLLAAAGVLEGQKATTNWFYRERLAAYGVDVVPERYCRSGKYITGAGVSASIDTGLFLASLIGGEMLAKTLQLGIEYYPDPPFAERSPAEAPPESVKMVAGFGDARARAQLAKPAVFAGLVELNPSAPAKARV